MDNSKRVEQASKTEWVRARVSGTDKRILLAVAELKGWSESEAVRHALDLLAKKYLGTSQVTGQR